MPKKQFLRQPFLFPFPTEPAVPGKERPAAEPVATEEEPANLEAGFPLC
jgi:hypothetical protein